MPTSLPVPSVTSSIPETRPIPFAKAALERGYPHLHAPPGRAEDVVSLDDPIAGLHKQPTPPVVHHGVVSYHKTGAFNVHVGDQAVEAHRLECLGPGIHRDLQQRHQNLTELYTVTAETHI